MVVCTGDEWMSEPEGKDYVGGGNTCPKGKESSFAVAVVLVLLGCGLCVTCRIPDCQFWPPVPPS